MFALWLALLPFFVLPASALLGGVCTWLALRRQEPGDGHLLGFFLAATLFFVGASLAVPRSDWFRERFDPQVRADRVVMADPVNAALRDTKPWEWEKLQPFVQQAAVGGMPPPQILARTREQQLPLVRHYLPFAFGTPVLRYAEAVLPALQELKARDPALCVRLAWKNGGPAFPVAAQLSPETGAAYQDAAGLVVRRAELDFSKSRDARNADPVAAPVEMREVQLAYRAILDELQPQHGDVVAKLRSREVAQLEPAAACDATIALFRRALDQDRRVAAHLLSDFLRD
ncbi:hypothetical protein HHL11_02640 [Ramlibacter sp. G-1-2-2]|uniref:Uncharacterized protein n=1 Tax=Ramlibacter agri TaxID=2728837 RepID=A0A848GZ16_9BURK|nr:hypothetical protein [Ramlibacter agri]NML42631.1 hypothetical protein [Ramlibacter agri]